MIEILIAITASVVAFLCGWHYNDFKTIFGKKAKRIKRETNHIQQRECFTSVDKINFNSNKKATLYSKPETFPQYLERVGAIKPKFELSEELKAKYGSFEDIPRPTRHKSEKEILDKFDIDIAKTCEEADKSYGEYYAGGFGWMKIPNNIVNGDDKPIEQTNKNNSLHKESFSQVVARVKSDMNNPSKQDNLTVRILKKFDTPEKQFQLLYDLGHIENHETFPLDKNGNDGC